MTFTFMEGNLLEADAEALVNTVNTVGVMGKGVALMFKEAFPENFDAYAEACERGEVQLGKMFVVERKSLVGPKWIINFPTKAHWRFPSQIGWIEDGLHDLKRVIVEKNIRSIALPPLGSGNGGLDWADVKPRIEDVLGSLSQVEVIVYEPTAKYQNVSKRSGVEKLTPARALIAELVRRYCILGIECTLLEIQKLAYFLDRNVDALKLENNFKFKFAANKFGPYSHNLSFLLNGLDGSYLHCDKRLADAGPFDVVRFDDARKDFVSAYLTSPEAKKYRAALEATAELIDGLESPYGMELLATVDWLVHHEGMAATPQDIRKGLEQWPGDRKAKTRKVGLFDERVIGIALDALASSAIGTVRTQKPAPS
jgi:O-acetyl-ADP-ribose deacetylase (regulator of RNase III)